MPVRVDLYNPEVYQMRSDPGAGYPPDGVTRYHDESGVTNIIDGFYPGPGTSELADGDLNGYVTLVASHNGAGAVQDGADTVLDAATATGLIAYAGTLDLTVSWHEDPDPTTPAYIDVIAHTADNRDQIGVLDSYDLTARIVLDTGTGTYIGEFDGDPLVRYVVPLIVGTGLDLGSIERLAFLPGADRVAVSALTVRIHDANLLTDDPAPPPPVRSRAVSRQNQRSDGLGWASSTRLVPAGKGTRRAGGHE